jgi:predicted dehydrogenase
VALFVAVAFAARGERASAECLGSGKEKLMKTYGVGVVGCGSVWDKGHKFAMERSKRVRCVRVYDTARERAEAAAAATGARVAGSLKEVLEDRNVDIVSVLTPAVTHADIVEIGAGKGKHFMLEKPMSDALADAERIVRAVADAKVLCFHPTLRALYPDLFGKLTELSAEEGPLGSLRCGLFHMVGDAFSWAPWFRDRTKCFPAAEYSSHVIDTFLALTRAEPVSVFAHVGRHCRDFNQDDVTSILVTFKDGRYFQMNVNWVLEGKWGGDFQRWDLVCKRGAIQHEWSGARWSGAAGKGEYVSPRTATQGNRWEHYDQLAEAIDAGGLVSPNERDGLAYMRIVDAARRSAKTGQPVFLDASPNGGISR